MTTILDKIVAQKRRDIEEAKKRTPRAQLEHRIFAAGSMRNFRAALSAPGIQVIAEIKRASPSAGPIRPDADILEIARTYEENGAACISVLTDGPFFSGSLDDLRQVLESVQLPILRKDFILDEYQIVEARVAGADAVLLIAEILTEKELAALLQRAGELGMAALVELYDPDNLERVIQSGATLIGINNRNLRTFETSLDHTIGLAARVPKDRLLVSESGIRTREDVLRLEQAGAKAILVGEILMKQHDIGAKLRELRGV